MSFDREKYRWKIAKKDLKYFVNWIIFCNYVVEPMFFTVAWSAQNSRFTMQIYETSGKCRTYRFSIDDDAPLRKMYKYELAKMYFPDDSTPSRCQRKPALFSGTHTAAQRAAERPRRAVVPRGWECVSCGCTERDSLQCVCADDSTRTSGCHHALPGTLSRRVPECSDNVPRLPFRHVQNKEQYHDRRKTYAHECYEEPYCTPSVHHPWQESRQLQPSNSQK